MSISLVAHTVYGAPGGGPFTTSAIDTTGANLICVYVSSDTGSSTGMSDSQGNTYTALTTHGTTNPNAARLYYCLSPTVGTSHTFTYGSTGFPSILVQAFSGVDSFDSQNGSSATSISTLQTGSVTPPANGCLVVTGTGSQIIPSSINSGFTITDSIQIGGGIHYAGGMAYLIQTSAASVNPTWTYSSSTNAGASIAVFLPVGAILTAQQQPIVLVLT